MQSVTAAMNLATLHKTAPTKFPHQAHHTTRTDINQDINIPTSKETDHLPPTMVTDMGDISIEHNHTAILTMTGAAAVLEGTHCTPHPAITAAHATLWLMDATITTHTMTHPTGIVTPHPALTISPTDITHATSPWTRASLTSATLHCTA